MKKRYIAFIALGIVLVLAGTFLVQATTIYDTQVIVKEADAPIGIAPFTDRIDFGDIPQGAGVGKTLLLENQGAVPNQINIFIIGGIADLVKVEPSSLTLEPGETAEVNFRMNMPVSIEPEKKFTGKVIILRLPKAFW